ncbi:hypothetical protein [Bacillus alkalicellulosilyticus]|uniref:hypothetical protein n=1 Tax=Alkalihalobacterium alkalicellulosilyticum TaxID=1912214 RepID=UPI0009965D0F|nr:hypothetical protein [Bacillus alkalicellulosilyticus]
MVELQTDMVFEMTTKFKANLPNVKHLRVVNVSKGSVSFVLEGSTGRGVFPIDLFLSLMRNGSLVYTTHPIEDEGNTHEETA